MENGAELFQVRFTEEGKKYIRKFADISYILMGLVFFNAVISIYFVIKFMILKASAGNGLFNTSSTFIERVSPYLEILTSILLIVSNLYFTRFPRALIRSLDTGNESDANQAFLGLFRCTRVFLFMLLISTVQLISIVAEKWF